MDKIDWAAVSFAGAALVIVLAIMEKVSCKFAQVCLPW